MNEKFVKFLLFFIPSSAARNKVRKKLLSDKTTYNINRRLYNLGEHSYIGNNIVISNPAETTIGKYCSISHGVFIGTSQHPVNFLTTHCLTYCEYFPELYGELRTPKESLIDISKTMCPPVEVGNDVWIGVNAIVMDGIKIGDGAVIAAGAVVTKDVQPYAIVGGVPAKVIKYRFRKEIINELLDIKWWDYPEDFITRLPFADIEQCIKSLKENKNLRR